MCTMQMCAFILMLERKIKNKFVILDGYKVVNKNKCTGTISA